MIKKGSWVNVRSTILEPSERAKGIPQDTSEVPLIMWVKGSLQEDAELNSLVTVRTRMGRLEKGILEEVNPSTSVDYGDFVPEILEIGEKARGILFGGGQDA